MIETREKVHEEQVGRTTKNLVQNLTYVLVAAMIPTRSKVECCRKIFRNALTKLILYTIDILLIRN